MNAIRAVAFRSGDFWVAQCLEHDLAALASRLDELPAELARVLSLHVEASRQQGVEPFASFPPAPPKFWRMYDESKSVVGPVVRQEVEVDLPEIDTRIAA